ncbi:MAG: murein L,D-transpeptidase [Pseudorhodoplanes sp.]
MRGHRIDCILASSALALVIGLSTPSFSQSVAPEEMARIEGRAAVATASAVAEPASTQSIAPSTPEPAPAATAPVAEPTATPANPEPVATPAVVPAPVAAEPAAQPVAAPAAEPAPAGVAAEPAAAQPVAAPAAEPAPATVTAEPPTAPEPVAQTAAVADQALSDRLRELLSSRNADRYFARRNERTAAEAFYKDRNYEPVFVEQRKQSPRGVAAVAYLQNVDADGLEPGDYPAPNFKEGDVDALAEAELRLTGEILEFARHASIGRVHFSRISNDIGFDQDVPEPSDILAKVSAAADLKQALDSYQPQHPQYKALKAALAKARGRSDKPAEEIVRIPEGPKLGANADDPRVTLLRKRLKIAGDPSSTVYDQDVVEAVRKFQQGAGLSVDGIAGPATLRALNGTGAQKRERTTDIIIANMDRWRWMPRDLGNNYVMLNIPEYRLRLYKDQNLYWETKVVVGKPSQATPIMTGSMKFITVNPTWNVPPSIIANEYLPAVRQDPGVLERMGLRMEQNRDGTVRIYQPPGDRNALGRIRFNFPNKFLVYQHDTPDKHLFAHDKRAYSHGCMRVENPLLYGEKLLSIMLPNEKYSQEKLRSMYGPAEININFPKTLPVHLTYQTAFVDDSGNLQIRDDIYGRDARHIAVFRSDERRVADVAQATRPTGTGISADQLRYQTREASPFADWFSSRNQQPVDRRGNRVVRNDPFSNFFGRLFR